MTDCQQLTIAVRAIAGLAVGWCLGPVLYEVVRLADIGGRLRRAADRWAKWRRSRDYMAIYRRALREPIDCHYAMRRMGRCMGHITTSFAAAGVSIEEAAEALRRYGQLMRSKR